MYIISIKVEKRNQEAPNIQEILTKYGDKIEARFGLHKIGKNGLIIVIYNSENIEEFIEEINAIGSIKANYMEA